MVLLGRPLSRAADLSRAALAAPANRLDVRGSISAQSSIQGTRKQSPKTPTWGCRGEQAVRPRLIDGPTIATLAILSGCVPVLERPFYCARSSDCTWGWKCDVAKNECLEPSAIPPGDENARGDSSAPLGDDGGGDEVTPGDTTAGDESLAIPPWAAVGSGYNHFCFISTTGEMRCAGTNSYGQTAVPAGSYEQVDCGLNHTCALKEDFTIACWGAGQVDTGDPHFGQADPPSGTFKAIAAGGNLSCALNLDDAITCWGEDADLVPTTGSWVQIAVGRSLTCAIRAGDNRVECWGEFVEDAPDEAFSQITVGYSFVCGLDATDHPHCWSWFSDVGGVESGLPNGTFTVISAADGHVCGIRGDDTAECWGGRDIDMGQADPPAGTFIGIASGAVATCGVHTDNSAECWGQIE